MSVYSALVFLHLLSAFLLIGGSTLTRVALNLMRSATTGIEAVGAFRAYAIAPKLIGPAVVVTVGTGLYLAWDEGYIWAFWVPASVVLMVALNVWLAIVVAPPGKVLSAAAQQATVDPVAHGGALLAAARRPRLHYGHMVMEAMNFTILVLMVFKPD